MNDISYPFPVPAMRDAMALTTVIREMPRPTARLEVTAVSVLASFRSLPGSSEKQRPL